MEHSFLIIWPLSGCESGTEHPARPTSPCRDLRGHKMLRFYRDGRVVVGKVQWLTVAGQEHLINTFHIKSSFFFCVLRLLLTHDSHHETFTPVALCCSDSTVRQQHRTLPAPLLLSTNDQNTNDEIWRPYHRHLHTEGLVSNLIWSCYKDQHHVHNYIQLVQMCSLSK